MDTSTKRLGALSLVLFLAYIIVRMFVEDESLEHFWDEFTYSAGIFHDHAMLLLSWGALSVLMLLGIVDKIIRWVRFGSGVKP